MEASITWLTLGMALVSREALAVVLATDKNAFGLGRDSDVRQLRESLESEPATLRWFAARGVVPEEGQRLFRAVLDRVLIDAAKREQAKVAAEVAAAARSGTPEEFLAFIEKIAASLASSNAVSGKLPVREAI